MKKILGLLLSALVLGVFNSAAAFAQADNGSGEGKKVVHVSFYKLPPGRQDEWLALYKKVHLPPGNKRKPDLTRTQLIHKLYPDLDQYARDERARWALTLGHWDEQWVEVDLEKNPSLYYPDPL